jgi:hypothetical protein
MGANTLRLPQTSSPWPEGLALVAATFADFPGPAQTPRPCLGVKDHHQRKPLALLADR